MKLWIMSMSMKCAAGGRVRGITDYRDISSSVCEDISALTLSQLWHSHRNESVEIKTRAKDVEKMWRLKLLLVELMT
jgi:hypothetical protein